MDVICKKCTFWDTFSCTSRLLGLYLADQLNIFICNYFKIGYFFQENSNEQQQQPPHHESPRDGGFDQLGSSTPAGSNETGHGVDNGSGGVSGSGGGIGGPASTSGDPHHTSGGPSSGASVSLSKRQKLTNVKKWKYDETVLWVVFERNVFV